MIVTFHDVRERRRIDDERRALERHRFELQRYECLGVMAGGIAHDFNNMLTSIIGNAEMLAADAEPNSPRARHAQRISQAATRAADLSHKLLAYTGTGRQRDEIVGLREVVGETLHFVETALPERVHTERHLTSDTPRICGDRGQITQAVASAIVNACEAQAGRPGRVSVATDAMRLEREYLAATHLAPDLPLGD